jgi:hypothetical protein
MILILKAIGAFVFGILFMIILTAAGAYLTGAIR